MTTTNTKFVAKVAAVIAGAGLVLSSFAIAMPAAAQSSSVTFTRDLTIGATGADVTALQNWLISKGFSIPAGATGYFGTQTQAAVAAYQAANGITPAAGYFGPITRAKVNAGGPVSGGDDDDDDDDDDSSDGELEGGEADLTDYELNDEESSGAEGEEGVELATAEFDVEDGDIRLERLEFDVQAESVAAGDSTKPWDFFDNLYVTINGDEVADLDVSGRDEWDENDDDSEHDASVNDWYRVTFTDLDTIVDEGDMAEITVSADIAESIDSDDLDSQQFTFSINDEGIRGRDAEGIDQYVGNDEETVTDFAFDDEETGDLDINSSSEDPDNLTLVSDDDDDVEIDDPVFVFELENNDDVDVLVTEITVDVATSSGDSLASLIEEATLVAGGEETDGDINADGSITFEDTDFIVGGDETIDVEVMITVAEDADGTIDFSVAAADVEAESDEDGDDATVSGSASSETHTVALTGVSVAGVSDETDTNDAGTIGTFELTFEVTAEGDDDVYIYNGAGQSDNDSSPFTSLAASTTGVAYTIFQSGSASTTDFNSDSATLTSGAETEGNYFRVDSGETEEFTLTVSIDPSTGSTALYFVELEAIRFDDENDTTVGTTNDTVYIVPDESEFQTGSETIASS